MIRFVRFLPFAVLMVFLITAFMYHDHLQSRVTIGEAAPSFTLEQLDGDELELASLIGKPIMVNFWTTWCKECRDESVALQRFSERFRDEVHVLGVNMREPPAVIRPFVERYGLTYPILLDRLEKVKRTYRVSGVPETWFIDQEGKAVGRHIGPITEEQLTAAAMELLRDGAKEVSR